MSLPNVVSASDFLGIRGSSATHARGGRLSMAGLLLLGLSGAALAADPAASSGAAPAPAAKSMQDLATAAFASHCVQCHASVFGMEGFPKLTPKEVYAALRRGPMQEPATGLDDGVLHALAQMLGNPEAEHQRPPDGGAVRCSASTAGKEAIATWRGWAADARNTRFVDHPHGRAAIESMQLKWSFTFPDIGFWQGGGNPVAVANGRVYVGNPNHWLYALDAQTGCAHWTFRADAPIRSGAAIEAGVVTFGDLWGNVYGLDEKTGVLKWRHLVDTQSFARITGSVTAEDGRVFVPVSYLQEILPIHPDRSCCTANGSAAAYDVRTGKPLWQTYMIEQPLQYQGQTPTGATRFGPSGAVIFTPPTVDAGRGLVYLATGNQTTGPYVPESDAIVALDLNTGARRWHTALAPEKFGGQDIYHFGCEPWVDPSRQGCPPENPGPGPHGDRDFAAPVMIVRRPDGKEVLVAGSKDGMLYALDPDAKGKVLWQLRLGDGGEIGGIQYGMATDGKLVFAPVSDADFIENTSDGSLNAVDLMTGKLLWRTPTPRDGCKGKEDDFCLNAIVSPPVVVGDAVIVGAMDGVLRAYDKRNGRIFWSYDAVRSYTGVNGLKGTGGGFGMGGVTIVGDMMYVSSGAGIFKSGRKGNALLAFQLGANQKTANSVTSSGDASAKDEAN